MTSSTNDSPAQGTDRLGRSLLSIEPATREAAQAHELAHTSSELEASIGELSRLMGGR